MMPLPARGAVLIRAGLLSVLAGLAGLLGGCVTTPSPLAEPPPYMLLPADEMASCDAIAASFQFSARRAARLEYWLARGPVFGYGFERFPLDAPKELVDERRRLDALSDLQREKGNAARALDYNGLTGLHAAVKNQGVPRGDAGAAQGRRLGETQ